MTITKKETCYDAPQVEIMEIYVENPILTTSGIIDEEGGDI